MEKTIWLEGGFFCFGFLNPRFVENIVTLTTETCTLIHRAPFINFTMSPFQSITFKVPDIHHVKWNKTSSFM